MGIQNLLRVLANSTRNAHISEFENEFVAIDAYCWLHKGIYSCAFELAMKKPTLKYVTYCMRYIEMLIHFKVKPILVFDGRQLSSKSETEKKRREERKKKYVKGKELMRAGKVIDGRRLLAESVDVTHELALNLIKECRKKNIDCIVAPFEADAQLAFFSINKIVKCIVTEDSDLLVYGCDKVLFKMDTSGRGKLVEKSQIHFSLNMTPEEFNEDIFRYMCILTGCDYLPSLPSIGPVFALKFVKMLKGNNIYETLPKLPIYTNKMKITVTNEYIDGFKIAENTFKHQIVYNPFLRLQVPLRPPKNDDDIVGTKLPEDLAFQLAVGNIDPISMKKVDNYDPDQSGTGFNILWKTDSLPSALPRQLSAKSPQEVNDSKKRQREKLEHDTELLSGWGNVTICGEVESVTNDLKKHCTPLRCKDVKGASAVNNIQGVPRSGFIFDPKVQNEKTNASKKNGEINLLKSRYFSHERENRNKKNPPENAEDRRKDESYEDYLQRLYDEYFPLGENEVEEPEAKIESENGILEEFCFSCGNTLISCSCSHVSETQKLNECLKDIKEFKKSRQKFNQHFLLDEINKNQSEILRSESSVKEDEVVIENSESDLERTSPDRTFSLNLSNILSKFDTLGTENAEDQVETEKIDKENAEINCNFELSDKKSGDSDSKDQELVRSPSPVFKVQKESKVLKKNCKLGNVSDTASTPISVYFSSGKSLNELNFQVSTKQTPLNSQRKISSAFGSSSVPSKSGKNNIKSSSLNRTLFQFGFKKQRRSEND